MRRRRSCRRPSPPPRPTCHTRAGRRRGSTAWPGRARRPAVPRVAGGGVGPRAPVADPLGHGLGSSTAACSSRPVSPPAPGGPAGSSRGARAPAAGHGLHPVRRPELPGDGVQVDVTVPTETNSSARSGCWSVRPGRGAAPRARARSAARRAHPRSPCAIGEGPPPSAPSARGTATRSSVACADWPLGGSPAARVAGPGEGHAEQGPGRAAQGRLDVRREARGDEVEREAPPGDRRPGVALEAGELPSIAGPVGGEVPHREIACRVGVSRASCGPRCRTTPRAAWDRSGTC